MYQSSVGMPTAPIRGVPVQEPRSGRTGVDKAVFIPAAVVALAFVLWGVLATDGLASTADSALGWLIESFGWLFVLSTLAFVAFAVFLGISRYGKIRLGKDGEAPEFRKASWVAMMFSAGMGIGLMFYGVAEPMSHMAAPPNGAAQPNTEQAASVAMEYSYFHWALHPWGIDGLAIFATLFGSATSLGLGALQINSGMNFLWDVEVSNGFAVAIIAALTAMFVVSAVSGVHRGVQWLSNGNMVLAILLLTFLLVVGPTVFIFDMLAESVGGYVSSVVPRSFQTGAFGDEEWLAGWTIFYWAWWISWAPFVGTFIARISRGRTVGEFVLGVLLIPSGVSFIWFAVLGGAAIDLQLSNAADISAAVAQAPEIGLFTTLEQFPLSGLTSLVVIVLVGLFFVSGADAASLVMGMLSSRGVQSPPRPVTIFWGVLTGASASVLLLAGGLEALQQASIIAAAPFVLVMLGLCVSLLKALRADE